jgi:cellulose synthase operon protein C
VIAHGRASNYLDGSLDAEEEAAFLEHVAGCAECRSELHAELQLRDREDVLRGAAGTAQHEMCGRAGEFLDGSLDGEGAMFLDHLAACTRCQHDLHGEVQLRDREDALRDATARRVLARGGQGGLDGPRRQPRRAAWLGSRAAAIIAAAAVILLVFVWRTTTRRETGQIALVSKPTRSIEIRLSHDAAAKHRPYDTMRDGASLGEPIAPSVVAELDRAGDCHGLATAYVLAGEWVRANEQYRHCPASIDIDADRAGLAVLRGELDTALDLTERVLAATPDHTVALWNRALALRGLGLEFSAAAAFERVAALEGAREPDWAREASERAQATRAEIDRIRTAYDDVERLGFEMVRGGRPIASALARQVPARSRVMLHDAIRTATTAARLDELAPLAAALEGHAGTDLARYVEEARAALSPARAAASAGYQEIVASPGAIDDRAWASWLALATRARADDLILGARILTGRLDGAPPAEQLAIATHDPWFERAVELERTRAALRAGRIEDAAARLAAIQNHCPAGTVSYRCLLLTVELARLEIDRHQPSEAKRLAVTAIAMARQLGEWPQRSKALTIAGDAERFGGDFASAGAYYEESGRSRDACGVRNAAFTTAEMLFQDHQIARARALVAAAPACDEAPGTVELTTLVRLLRAGRAVLDRTAVTAEIARTRAAPEFVRDAPYLDYLTAWVALDDDPAARGQLASVAESARKIEGSMRDKTIAAVENALFADAGRRGAWSDALAVVARARGVEPPARCALAIGADDFRFTAIAVGADGALAGRYQADLVRTTEWSVPEPMRQQLVGCGDVAVLALSPWLGIGLAFDAQTPWHYVLGPPRSSVAGRRHVVITEPATPPEARLAPLAPRTWPSSDGPDELITGPAATPERVLTAISDATLVEIHSHATWLDRLDAPVLALAPGENGWTLGAAKIRTARLTGAPVVVLADCAGGATARFEHEAWGLPLALRVAGARAVIAPLTAIPDRDATTFFDAVTAELAGGTAPAVAVARVRAEKMRGDPTSWMIHVVVFQ